MGRYREWSENDDLYPSLLQVPDQISGHKSVLEHVTSRCVFVGKGPSAPRASERLDGAHLATVNEACLLFDGAIDYAFFTDARTIRNSEPAWHRIRHFVTTPVVHGDRACVDPPVQVSDIDRFPLSRLLVVPQSQLPQHPESVHYAIHRGLVCYTDTATMGAHILAMLGYRHLHLYGHDGGVGYAPGVPCVDPYKDNSQKRELLEILLSRLAVRYGLTWEFASDSPPSPSGDVRSKDR